MHVLDLFCGAGGSSLGMKNFGLDPIGFDICSRSCETRILNGLKTVRADLNYMRWSDYKCDLMWASPPCQPFSFAGPCLGPADKRDGMPALKTAIRDLLPNIVIMENVKGLIYGENREYLNDYFHFLISCGYKFDWRILNCADFGVPQTRERVFIIARQDSGRIGWPTPTVDNYVSMSEAIGWESGYVGMPRKERTNAPSLNGWRIRDLIPVSQPSGSLTSRSRSWMHYESYDQVPKDGTPLTIQQLAKLQGFPDDFVWNCSKNDAGTQIANAVPPIVAELILESL